MRFPLLLHHNHITSDKSLLSCCVVQLIYLWLALSVFSLLAFSGGFTIIRALKVMGALVDSISFYFFMFNFAAGGVVSIFYTAPGKFKQGYLIIISAIMVSSSSMNDERVVGDGTNHRSIGLSTQLAA